ncbi:MAG: hypothetical protein BHV89_15685 [Clostridiales bacterium 41_21_two_genomes]|nr:MAG: hypothetical protein BHV89_15685 [Clostridiales bacterium 41_21_two_genomes]
MIVKNATFGNIQNNCYLVVDEKTNCSALVDCTEFSQKMLDFIGETDLKYIFLTHGHFDHITGVKGVKEKYGARVVISHEDAPMLSSAKLSLAAFCGGEQNIVEPDILVSDGDVVKLNDIEFKVISTPGHTKGGVCYLVGDYIFTGDTLFFCSCGRTDFPGGSSQEIIASLKKIAALDGDLKVMPGHDRLSNLNFERENNPYMKM